MEESRLQEHLKKECKTWYKTQGTTDTVQCNKYACTPNSGTNLSSSKLTSTAMFFMMMWATPDTALRSAIAAIGLATVVSAGDDMEVCQRRIFLERIRGLEARLKEAMDTVANQAVTQQSSTRREKIREPQVTVNMQDLAVQVALYLIINCMVIISLKITVFIIKLVKSVIQIVLL